MKEIIGKSKFRIKKLSHRIVINEKEIIDEKTIAEKLLTLVYKYWTKTSFKNTGVKYTF